MEIIKKLKTGVAMAAVVAVTLFILPVVVFASQIGQSVATLKIYDSSELALLNIIYLPEKRVSLPGGNHSTYLRLRFTNPETNEIRKEEIVTTNSNGIYSGLSRGTLVPNFYNIYAKGTSTLTHKVTGLYLDAQLSEIDFSNDGVWFGSAGDVNGTNFGDDIVNSIDLSVLINTLDSWSYRTDLNADAIVNALDLSVMITNIDETGDV